MRIHTPPSAVDVVVVGSGNAGFSAAVSAAERGAGRVILIDKCPAEWAGGNSFFAAGAFRTVHDGTEDILPIVNNVDSEIARIIDPEPYSQHDFRRDVDRMTSDRTDPALSQILIDDSNDAIKWLASNGVRFQLSFNRQAYKVSGRFKFWGGMTLKTEDGGKGLTEDHEAAARRHGVEVYHSTPARRIVTNVFSAIVGLVVECNGVETLINTRAVILAAGGFESNPRLRAQYLGPGWDFAWVRGTPYNTGEALHFAIRDVNARQAGGGLPLYTLGCQRTSERR